MLNKLISKLYFTIRKIAFSTRSNISFTLGNFNANQPVVIRGQGKVIFGKKVNFGVVNSPLFYNSYAYIEARGAAAKIEFGNNIKINNGFSIIAESSIVLKNDILIGFNCCIMDSNFHNLEPLYRNEADPEPKPVTINNNVFIGNNVNILKGVSIGKNTVVAAGSVVTKSFPANVIIAGSPAEIIKELKSNLP
jgi:maltose O-acetyltransferase